MDKQQVRELWVNALESGEYEQCNMFLHKKFNSSEQFCCLGVLCDLYMKHVGGLEVEYYGQEHNVYYDGHISELPEKVREWVGLHSGAGDSIRSGEFMDKGDSLANLNDRGASFEYIAGIIEQSGKELFVESN